MVKAPAGQLQPTWQLSCLSWALSLHHMSCGGVGHPCCLRADIRPRPSRRKLEACAASPWHMLSHARGVYTCFKYICTMYKHDVCIFAHLLVKHVKVDLDTADLWDLQLDADVRQQLLECGMEELLICEDLLAGARRARKPDGC
eukprot:135268-Chlamydomonas_euryale.AAC.1